MGAGGHQLLLALLWESLERREHVCWGHKVSLCSLRGVHLHFLLSPFGYFPKMAGGASEWLSRAEEGAQLPLPLDSSLYAFNVVIPINLESRETVMLLFLAGPPSPGHKAETEAYT